MPKSATQAEREALAQAHTVSVNEVGFQIGAAPVDVQGLAAYFKASGAPELAAAALDRSATVSAVLKASDQAQWVATQLSGAKALAPLGFVLQTTGAVLGAGAGEAYKDFDRLAEGYNQRVYRALGLPISELAAQGRRGLPAPMGPAALRLGLNAGFEDLVWERRLHLWHRRSDFLQLFWPRPDGIALGGQMLNPSRVRQAFEVFGSSESASLYGRGRTECWSGFGLELLGLAGIAAQIVQLSQGSGTSNNGALGLVGVGCFVGGIGMLQIGLRDTVRGISLYQRELPGRLSVSLKIPLPLSPSTRP
jgi:hypothetical protein